MDSMSFAGWSPIMAPAKTSEDSENGTKGGAMVLHKPEDDLACKRVRISGLHVVLATM